jgi:hypothetical protein
LRLRIRRRSFDSRSITSAAFLRRWKLTVPQGAGELGISPRAAYAYLANERHMSQTLAQLVETLDQLGAAEKDARYPMSHETAAILILGVPILSLLLAYDRSTPKVVWMSSATFLLLRVLIDDRECS